MGNLETKRLHEDKKYDNISDIYGTDLLKQKIINIRESSEYPPYLTKDMLLSLKENDDKLYKQYVSKYRILKSKTIDEIDKILESIFYPIEQLCQLSDENLFKLLKDRNISEMTEEALIKWQVEKIISTESQCATFQKTYEYYSSTGYIDINTFLRYKSNGLPDKFFYPLVGGKRCNIRLLYCVYQLDTLIINSNKFGDGKTIYYRGIKPSSIIAIESIIENEKKIDENLKKSDFKFQLTDYGFSSITKNIDIARRFVKTGYCCILMFIVPENIRYTDKSDETSEQELVMERNIVYYNFLKKGQRDGVFIIECEIYKEPYFLNRIYNGKRNKIVEAYDE
jgi:hypothetical protein